MSRISRHTLRSRSAGALRVSIYFSVIAVGLLYWSVRSAYAGAERAIRDLGEHLTAELGPSLASAPHVLQLNGQNLLIASKQSELSVREVLDRFDATCTTGSTDLRAQFALPAPADPARHDELFAALRHDPARLAVLRRQSEEEGHLSCLAQPKDRRGFAATLRAVEDFLESGDLSVLGDLRYVAARKQENGMTHVIAIWSEGELRIGSVFPKSGDAPGTDLPDVPRPPETTRQLSATADGRSFGLRLYDSARPKQEVLVFYEREMPRNGWQPLPTMLEAGTLQDGTVVRAFTRHGRAVAIGIDGEIAGKTGISLIDLGSVRRSTASGESPLD